nr:adenylyltransferase/cytidyltransferase family protein [Paenibacillus larvae]
MMEMIHLNYPIDKSVISKLPEKQVMAIGQFDGVHLGHQEVIGRALSMASEKKIPSAVMTFYPHPKEVLGQQIYTDVITPWTIKWTVWKISGLIMLMYCILMNPL